MERSKKLLALILVLASGIIFLNVNMALAQVTRKEQLFTLTEVTEVTPSSESGVPIPGDETSSPIPRVITDPEMSAIMIGEEVPPIVPEVVTPVPEVVTPVPPVVTLVPQNPVEVVTPVPVNPVVEQAVRSELNGQDWLKMVEDATTRNEKASIKVEDILDPEKAKLFVDTVLQEEYGIRSDEVTAIIRNSIPELFNSLGTVTLNNNTNVDLTAGAAVYKWGYQGRWCKGPHVFTITNMASVNQWIRAAMSKTHIAWKVFKPGIYTTDCMYLNVHSNGLVNLNLLNGGPLYGINGGVIPSRYALTGNLETAENKVFMGDDLNNIVRERVGSEAEILTGWVAPGETETIQVDFHKKYKLWNTIAVGTNVRPGLYENPASAVITLTAVEI